MTDNAPFLISWNVTKRCNLKCGHCYLDAKELAGADEASHAEALWFVDEIAGLAPGAMLILTGGEPLLRPDAYEIAGYASRKGLAVVVGSNGTLIDDKTVARLAASGVKGVGLSLDAASAPYHDRFRGVEGAWAATVNAACALRRNGMDFQIQLTVTSENRDEIPAVMELAAEKGAKAVNVFFLVCTGRGQEATGISAAEYEETLVYLAKAEAGFRGRVMVRARCAPHFLRVVSAINPHSPLLQGATSGCIAGRGYLRITPSGFVTPCPYIPVDADTPSLRNKPLKEIWEHDPLFLLLRKPQYKGRCAECEFSGLCGGCRAKAYAAAKDIMAEDPWCAYVPQKKTAEADAATPAPVWTAAAAARLHDAPVFLRGMIKTGVERFARHNNLAEITPELMAAIKRRMGR